MKDVKFNFYQLEYEIEDNLLDFDLKKYFESNFRIKEHLFEIGEHKAFLDKKVKNIYSFQKFRRDFNPIIKDENTGLTREVQLKESEYFIEESYIYMDIDTGIIIYQKNHTGYTSIMFERYIKKLLNNKFKNNFFTLKPIMSEDGIEKIMNHNIAKSIEFKVAFPNIGLLNDLGLDATKIRDLDYDSFDSIEIKINSKRKRGLFTLSNLMNVLDLTKNKDKYKKLKIKASSSYEGTGDVVDLLDDFYVVTEKIKLKDKSKVMDKDDIIIKLQIIYDNNIEKIRGIVDV